MDAPIRPVTASDLPSLRQVIGAAGLFPADLLDGTVAVYLQDDGDDLWLACDAGGPGGVLYCAPERLTEGTWNMLLVAVHPDRQREGLGTALVQHLEALLAARGERILLVETSGLPEFEATRAFYCRRGYAEEARIREFYRDGEYKIVFRKALRAV